MNGHRALVTNALPNNLGLGTDEHLMIYSRAWENLIIGIWGTLDVLVDPYKLANSGGLSIHVFSDIDIALRHGESFSKTRFAL